MTTRNHPKPKYMEQESMLHFALRWLHYGGGPAADMFVEFGISERVYFERLTHVAKDSNRISDATREQLLSLCKTRLGRNISTIRRNDPDRRSA